MRCAPALLKVSTVQPAPSSERPAATQSVLPSIGATKPSSETDIFRTREAMRCFLSGMDARRRDAAAGPPLRSVPPSVALRLPLDEPLFAERREVDVIQAGDDDVGRGCGEQRGVVGAGD